MRGNYSKTNDRLILLQEILDECSRLGHKFKNISCLAEYCVDRMYDRQRLHLISMGASKGSFQSCVEKMNYRSLLKGTTYRKFLDLWMTSNSSDPSADQLERRELQVKLLRLSNEYETVKKLFIKLQEDVELSGSKKAVSHYNDEGFVIVKALLDRFSSYVFVEDGALKERSVVKTTYVNARAFRPYLEWLEKEI